MTTLSEMIGRRPTPEALHPHKGTVIPFSTQIQVTSGKPHARYEAEIFNFLLDKRRRLGIKSVRRFKALLLDGAVELMDGKLLGVEIKFRMNWLKACQAEWQFRNFLKRHNAVAGPIEGGLVFFKEFSGDWQRPAPSGRLQNGWNHWYRSHSEIGDLHLDLLRLHDGTLETFHDAIAADLGKPAGDYKR